MTPPDASSVAGRSNAAPIPGPHDPLRIAWLIYRGNPHCGGQGVYTRYMARELTALGHHVEVFAGAPYPELDQPEQLVKVEGLHLYPRENPFRVPWPWEFRDSVDVREFAIMCTAGFPEPYAYSLRARRMLRARRADFDLIHDNQCFGTGLLGMMDDGWPLCATLHHPITVDRDLDLAHATTPYRRWNLKRWYAFLDMQMKVARQVPRLVTVSNSSRRDITAQMGVPTERMNIVGVGVDPALFRPLPHVARVPGRLMVTTSSDVPMKGLVPFMESLAKLRVEHPEAHAVVIGRPRDKSAIPGTIERLGLENAVEFVSGVSDERIVELYAEATVAVVPSLYEGFSLPAIEAMACGVPLVTTTGGALPEVVGIDGVSAFTVEPNDPSALAAKIAFALEHDELRAQVAENGRARALSRYSWRVCAEQLVEQHRTLLAERPNGGRAPYADASTGVGH